ncbi:hypothetical protein LCGC14_1616740 [marine sediment metagenome]|uniref:Linalool dehydratase/isomerase domain-containing protein n=1 Tax=marine sediment metagenome TaxID=412755 RepID=A0A0F9L6P5_9ZZZZ
MRWMQGCAVVIVCGFSAAAGLAADDRAVPAAGGVKVIADVQARLLRAFEDHLDNPRRYAKLVAKQCRMFPEGDLFPYVLPAIAYANLALGDPKRKDLALKRMGQCIDLAIPGVLRRVRPPGGKLEKLRAFNKNATYLGQLNLALGYYRLIGGDDRYDKMHKRISDVLHTALVERQGRPLESYPQYTWPFDTIPCLVSLALYDRHTGLARSDEIARKHLKWVQDKATDPVTGLPVSRADGRTGKAWGRPRGCDLSLRLALLAHIDRPYATKLYRNYVKHFWIDHGAMAGFAEWPGGKGGRQDADSGPIIMGIGMSATGLGIGAAIAMDDRGRLRRLCAQIPDLKQLMAVALRPAGRGAKAIGGMIPYRKECVTGFLFGDACLFYAVTWHPLGASRVPSRTRHINQGRP